MEELQDHGIFEGNAYQDGRQLYSHVNMRDLVRTAGFANEEEAAVAMVEAVSPIGELNERRSQHYSCDATHTIDYPYPKTEVGILQLPKMPWDYQNSARNYLATSVVSFIVGASIF